MTSYNNVKHAAIIHASKDETFAKLLENPETTKKALEQVAKELELVDDWEKFQNWLNSIDCEVRRETEKNIILVLPYLAEEEREYFKALTQEELKKISGGRFYDCGTGMVGA